MSETPAVEPGTPATPAPPASENTESVDSLPKWARDKLTKANDEAATYRVKARDARTEVEAEFNTKLTEVSGERDAARLEVLKLKATLAVEIPGESATEFSALLQGTTEDELVAHAEKLKSMFGIAAPQKTDRPVDPTQGLGGGAEPQDAFGAFILSNLRQ